MTPDLSLGERAVDDAPPGNGRLEQWCAVPAASLDWACWDDDCAIYHRESGQTHFLNAAAAALLRDVLIVPKGAAEAATRLAELQGGVADGGFAHQVLALILRLEELGLVRRVAGR